MIGALRHRIELLSPARAADEAGGASVDWLPGPDIWAEVQRLTSVRDLSGDREARLKRIAATIRFRSDILLGWRLRFDGGIFEVVSIESEDGREARLTLVCEEVRE